MKKDFTLLQEYMYEYIDKMKPISLDLQISIWSKKGYVEYGHNNKTFPDFETWKKIKIMFKS